MKYNPRHDKVSPFGPGNGTTVDFTSLVELNNYGRRESRVMDDVIHRSRHEPSHRIMKTRFLSYHTDSIGRKFRMRLAASQHHTASISKLNGSFRINVGCRSAAGWAASRRQRAWGYRAGCTSVTRNDVGLTRPLIWSLLFLYCNTQQR